MTPPPIDFEAAIGVLVRHEVDFIVVGGLAAILAGAPVSTFDLDIVHDRGSANVARLLGALREMETIHRDPAGRRVEPRESLLEGPGHNLLIGRFGPIDILGAIAPGLGWAELLPRSRRVAIGTVSVRVLELEAIIESKAWAGREKDRAVLPILRRTLELRERRGGSGGGIPG